MRRIQERSRGCESGITLEYLTSLYNAYETFISEISRIIPVIKVDYSRFRTAEEMADAIAEEYSDLSTVRYVSWGKARSSARPNEKATDAKVEATKSEDIVAPTIA